MPQVLGQLFGGAVCGGQIKEDDLMSVLFYFALIARTQHQTTIHYYALLSTRSPCLTFSHFRTCAQSAASRSPLSETQSEPHPHFHSFIAEYCRSSHSFPRVLLLPLLLPPSYLCTIDSIAQSPVGNTKRAPSSHERVVETSSLSIRMTSLLVGQRKRSLSSLQRARVTRLMSPKSIR